MEKLDTQGEQWWVNKAQWLSYNRTEFMPEAQIFLYTYIFATWCKFKPLIWNIKNLTEFVVLKFLSSTS